MRASTHLYIILYLYLAMPEQREERSEFELASAKKDLKCPADFDMMLVGLFLRKGCYYESKIISKTDLRKMQSH